MGENWGAPQADVRTKQKGGGAAVEQMGNNCINVGEGAVEGDRGAEPREEGKSRDEQLLLDPPAPHGEQVEVEVTTL